MPDIRFRHRSVGHKNVPDLRCFGHPTGDNGKAVSSAEKRLWKIGRAVCRSGTQCPTSDAGREIQRRYLKLYLKVILSRLRATLSRCMPLISGISWRDGLYTAAPVR